MRVVFAGSPAVAVPYLDALVAAGFDVVTAITRTDSPQGRKRVLRATPVADAAERLGVSVIKTNSLRGLDIPDCEVAVVVAYGGLVPQRLLERPVHGWLNMHFSVLPEYRGAAPVQRSLWDGNDAGGVTIFQLVEQLDAGPVLLTRRLSYRDDETATEALHRFARETTDELVGTLRLVEVGALHPVDQVGEPSFAPKFSRSEGRVDWTLPAQLIAHRIRAVTEEPGAYTVLGELTLGIVRARVGDSAHGMPGSVSLVGADVVVGTGEGTIVLETVKPAGKIAMSAVDWFRGLRGAVTFE